MQYCRLSDVLFSKYHSLTARGEAPYVSVITSDVELTEGEDEELRCAATGVPEPNFIWTKQDGELAENVSLVQMN